MSLLSEWFKVNNITEFITLLAGIATCITAISVIIALKTYVKNNFTKKTFKVIFNGRQMTNKYFAQISFQNYTNKKFSITDCDLIIDSKKYKMLAYNYDGHFVSYLPFKDIRIQELESYTIEKAFFSIPINTAFPKEGIFEVHTTLETLRYKIMLTDKDSWSDSEFLEEDLE